MANKVYVGQTDLRISLDTGEDLNAIGATTLRIYYRKPDGVEGFRTGTIEDLTKIYYDIQDTTELDQPGWFAVWSYATISSRVIYGESVKFYVSAVGH